MLGLFFDTVVSNLRVFLQQDETILAEIQIEEGQVQASNLLVVIEQLLRQQHLQYGELDFIGTVKGAGSFTGIRISLTTAKILQLLLNIPVILLTNFELLSWPQWHGNQKVEVWLSAHRGEIFHTILPTVVDQEVSGADLQDLAQLWTEKLMNITSKLTSATIQSTEALRQEETLLLDNETAAQLVDLSSIFSNKIINTFIDKHVNEIGTNKLMQLCQLFKIIGIQVEILKTDYLAITVATLLMHKIKCYGLPSYQQKNIEPLYIREPDINLAKKIHYQQQ